MADFPLLKNFIDIRLARQIADRIGVVYPEFARQDFVAAVDAGLHELELKPRFAFVADKLRDFLPSDYPTAVAILLEILDAETHDFEPIEDAGFRLLPIATFVERHGFDHPRESLDAMHIITRSASCESAIRPFIMRYPAQTLAQLQIWAKDGNEHVRRLVSEGTRPRLPWSPQLTDFIADPAPTLELLEHLKDDPSLYVRRSVANHLNDISKDHPDIVLSRLEKWSRAATRERKWLINHALRTLVKKGDARALALLGYGAPQVSISELQLEPQEIAFGKDLRFSFRLQNIGDKTQNLMIDFLMHFVKANGKTSAKVFKLKTATLAAGESMRIEKSHSIRPISTRKYYPGRQRLEIQVNGIVLAGCDYELVMDGD